MKPTPPKPKISQCLIAEFFGTFVLTFVDAAVGILDHHGSGIGGVLSRSVAPAAVVAAMIFLIGEISGAHINPAVTIGFALRRVFPWRKVPLYLLCQFFGAFAAGTLLFALFGHELHDGLTLSQKGPSLALAVEVVLSWFLITAILTSSSDASIRGWESAFPVSTTLLVCGLIGKNISGASMNPARTFGPALVLGQTQDLSLYFLGPFAGAALACVSVFLLKGPPCEKEIKAAKGE